MVAPTLIGDVPARAADAWGRRTAVLSSRGRLTYRDLSDRVDALAARLRAAGIRPGERVAIHLENREEYLVAYFAVPACGAALVPVNTFLAPEEARAILDDCGAASLITSGAGLERLAPALDGTPVLRHVLLCEGKPFASVGAPTPPGLTVEALGRPEARSAPERTRGQGSWDPDGTAVIIYTSGTTGAPKGVMLSHRGLLANARACAQAVGITPKDRVIVFLPLFHSFTQMVGVLAPMVSGMSVLLCERLDRVEIKKALMRWRPTIFPAIPAVFTAMAHARVGKVKRWLNPVRLYISGGAPLPLDTLGAFERQYRRPLCEGYGLSEASPVVSLNPPEGPRKPGSVGVPLPGVEVRIAGEDGVDAPPGQTGELLVRGLSLMRGYLRREQETREALRGGWLHTGDLARLDEDGYLYIMGRSKEMLICRGMNVYPREIEQVLETHPAVKEAAVVGVPDESRGEVPCAFVVPHPDKEVTERELKQICASRLARYKVPRSVNVVVDLPRNPAGKVLKEALKAGVAISPRADRRPGGRLGRVQRPGR